MVTATALAASIFFGTLIGAWAVGPRIGIYAIGWRVGFFLLLVVLGVHFFPFPRRSR